MKLRFCFNKSILFILVCFSLANFSCLSFKRATLKTDYIGFTSYNKVRIDINSGFSSVLLKGYIYIIPDTQICFRLWESRLGYEVGRGLVSPDKILFYNAFEEQLMPDIKELFENLSGCAINLTILQNLLLGNVGGFIASLNKSNVGLISIHSNIKSNRAILNVTHKVNHSDMLIYFSYSKGQLRNIQLKIKKDKIFTEISFDLVDISYDRKICTFAF